MIIDIHTHTFPDKIAAAAVEKLAAASRTRPFTNGTAEGLRTSMARAGVDLSVVMPVATAPRQVPHINDAALRANETAAETGILSFGCMHPDYADWHDELGRIARAGIKGVKLHPPYQEVDFDDPRYLRILDRCGELGLIVLIHAGLDVGLPGHREATPEKIARALRAAGPVTLILAHMGGWQCWARVSALLPAFDNVYLDTSFSLGPMTPLTESDYPRPASRQRLTEADFIDMIRLFRPDHILFGTDSPWEDQAAEIAKIRALPLTDEEKTAILGKNTQQLLKLSQKQ